MYKYIYSVIAFAIAGCTTDIVSQEYSSGLTCPKQKVENVSDYDYAGRLWVCGDKLKAASIAKEGADRGDVKLMSFYAVILKSINNQDFGLVYEIKAAERGDFASVRSILRTSKRENIHSLDYLIFKGYLAYFRKANRFTVPVLKEYIDYTLSNVSGNNYVAASYALAYIELTKNSEMDWYGPDYKLLAQKLRGVTDKYGVTKKVLVDSQKIINQPMDDFDN